MAASTAFIDYLREQMAGFAPVSRRRMFGGAGIFRDGLMFALVADDVLYFKADEPGAEAFKAEGLEPFSYPTKTGIRTLATYWRAPERLLDDPDEMALWCRRAYDVALKAAKARR